MGDSVPQQRLDCQRKLYLKLGELASRGGPLLVCVAEPAAGGCIVLAVAIDTAGHGRHIGCLCHDLHLFDSPVACLAGHLGFQMRTMIPVNPTGDDIHANPGNWLIRFCKLAQLLDSRFFFRNCGVTGHALCRRWKCHAVSRFGIGVALLTRQPEGQMLLMTVRNRLDRRFGLFRIVQALLVPNSSGPS